MNAEDMAQIKTEILRKFPGTDPEMDVDWDMMEISFKAGYEACGKELDEILKDKEVE